MPAHVPSHSLRASQPRSLTAGGALSNRGEPPEVMLAVERAREALAVCERLSAGRVEEWPRTAMGHATRAAGAPWHGSRYRLRCGVCTLYHTHPLDPGRAFPRFVFILCKSKLCVCALSLPQ